MTVVEKSVKFGAKSPETAPKLKDFISWAGNELFGYFQVIGYLMGKEILEVQLNLCPWQLVKGGNRQGVLADFAKSAKTLRLHILG